MKTVSVIGCGWLGLALSKSMLRDGYKIKGTTTSYEKLHQLKALGIEAAQFQLGQKIDPDILNSTVAIINIPPRHPKGSDKTHLDSQKLLLSEIRKSTCKNIVFISSTGVYPTLNREVVEEDADYSGLSRAGISLLEIEDIFRHEPSIKSTILRFSGLVGPDRHPGNFLALKQQIPGSDAPVNLIHQEDCISIIKEVVEQGIWGDTFQASIEDHSTKKEFYTSAAKSINQQPPTFSNKEADYKIVNSTKLRNRLNYRFKYQKLTELI